MQRLYIWVHTTIQQRPKSICIRVLVKWYELLLHRPASLMHRPVEYQLCFNSSIILARCLRPATPTPFISGALR
jgi:hypothetical protein